MLGSRVAKGINMGGICDTHGRRTWIGDFGKSHGIRMNGRQGANIKMVNNEKGCKYASC